MHFLVSINSFHISIRAVVSFLATDSLCQKGNKWLAFLSIGLCTSFNSRFCRHPSLGEQLLNSCLHNHQWMTSRNILPLCNPTAAMTCVAQHILVKLHGLYSSLLFLWICCFCSLCCLAFEALGRLAIWTFFFKPKIACLVKFSSKRSQI